MLFGGIGLGQTISGRPAMSKCQRMWEVVYGARKVWKLEDPCARLTQGLTTSL